MTSGLVLAVLVLSGVLLLVGLAVAAAGHAPPRAYLRGLLLLQLVLLAQLVAVGVALSGGDRPRETGAFAGYLVLSLLLLPGALALTVEEQTRWGTLVMALGCLVVAVVELRLDLTWS